MSSKPGLSSTFVPVGNGLNVGAIDPVLVITTVLVTTSDEDGVGVGVSELVGSTVLVIGLDEDGVGVAEIGVVEAETDVGTLTIT